jgi:outer membrane protein OmpA-like peptidoglycan-associated protein
MTNKWSAEAVFQQFSSTTGGIPSGQDFEINSFRMDINYNYAPGTRIRPYLAFGIGAENTKTQGTGPIAVSLDPTDLSLNGGGGVRFFLTHTFLLRWDVRLVATDVRGAVDNLQTNLETSLGLGWAFGGGPPPDEDEDGVRDRKDHCPGTPHGAIVDEVGCPSDADGDGVFNGIDQCPDTPAGATVDAEGCPADSDGDGVFDGIDQCPDTPTGATVDAQGCPTDSDGDGVFDGVDQCPDTPTGATVDEKGCPADSDGDGVFDGIDQCPDTPTGATVDAQGCPMDGDGDGVYDGIDKCPDTPPGTTVNSQGCEVMFKEGVRTLVLKDVNYASDSAELTAASRSFLDTVFVGLSEVAQDATVEIAGHTDSTGSRAHNVDLSERRAESARQYLIAKGIDPARMTAKGYGPDEPVADNSTPDGRAMNRRVELRRLDVAGDKPAAE